MYQNYLNTPYTGNAYQNTNPYMNPYQSRLDSMQQSQMMQYQITKVNGKNGAEAFRMPPNSNILLLDESAPIVWLKQTDGAGYATVTPYAIAPYQEAPEPDFSTLEERIKRLEDKLNESYATNAQPNYAVNADATAE